MILHANEIDGQMWIPAEEVQQLQAENAALKAELETISKHLGCHRAFILDEIDQLNERADAKPNADEHRQLQAELAAAQLDAECWREYRARYKHLFDV